MLAIASGSSRKFFYKLFTAAVQGKAKKRRHSGPTSSFFNAVMAAAAKKSVEELLGRPTRFRQVGYTGVRCLLLHTEPSLKIVLCIIERHQPHCAYRALTPGIVNLLVVIRAFGSIDKFNIHKSKHLI